ncbi:P-loop NTPase fold protein, partial [Chloroflexota bacterium]
MSTEKSEAENTDLLTDEPISDPAQDRLGRDTFAANLTESLLSYENHSCLTLAIYGRWGSGKTSLMNLIEKHLRDVC